MRFGSIRFSQLCVSVAVWHRLGTVFIPVLVFVIAISAELCGQENSTNTPPTREELQSRYEKASKLYAERKWHDAAEEFRWLSSQSPGSLLASYSVVYEAECLAEDGENERALTLLSNWLQGVSERLASADVANDATLSAEQQLAERARLRVADLAHRQGNAELSTATYQVLIQANNSADTRGRALLALARFYQSQGDAAKAADHFGQVLASPDLAAFHDAAKLGAYTLQLGGENAEAAIKGLQDIVDATPVTASTSAAAFQLAQYFYAKAQYDSAQTMYDKVIALGSEHTALPYAYLGSANALYQLTKKDEARARLQEYLEKYPTDSNWTKQAYQFIRWQLAAGQIDIAQQWLDRLHDIGFATNEEEIEWLRTKSFCGRIAKQPQVATDALRSAILLAEGNTAFELRKELLAVMLENGDAAGADAELVVWIEQCRTAGASDQAAFFEIKRMEYLAQRREWSTLAPLVESWLAQNATHPQRPDVLLVRAQCEIGTVRIDDARVTLNDEVFKSDATLDRQKAQAMWLTGETYFLQKDYVAAVAAYSAVVQKCQDAKWRGLAMLQAGKCYEIVGQSQDAIQLYEEALKLSPVESVKKQIEARLNEAKQTRTSSLTPASRNTIPSR